MSCKVSWLREVIEDEDEGSEEMLVDCLKKASRVMKEKYGDGTSQHCIVPTVLYSEDFEDEDGLIDEGELVTFTSDATYPDEDDISQALEQTAVEVTCQALGWEIPTDWQRERERLTHTSGEYAAFDLAQYDPKKYVGHNNSTMQGDKGIFETAVKLWRDVEGKLSTSKIVVWTEGVDSLEYARRYSHTSAEAREFVDKCMLRIVQIFLDQQPAKIGEVERDCVKKALRCSLQIICDDLSNANKDGSDSPTLGVLNEIFNTKRIYYRKRGVSNAPEGLPELRVHMIHVFRRIRGFKALEVYLNARAATPLFPNMALGVLLRAVSEFIYHKREIQDLAHEIANATKKHLSWLEGDAITEQVAKQVNGVGMGLYQIHSQLSESNPKILTDCFCFWRTLALKWVSSQSFAVMRLGWLEIRNLVKMSEKNCPPPRAFIVSGAGSDFVNGRYEFYPKRVLETGYVKGNTEFQYHRQIPADYADEEIAGKTLTLFRCKMRSQHKWWFLSIPDLLQPGTDLDIDYYQLKSRPGHDLLPLSVGWLTCRAGDDPAPSLTPLGILCKEGGDYPLELAKWAIDNKLVELAFGSSHHSIVKMSSNLINFLARMYHKVEWLSADNSIPNKFCLNADHLLLASVIFSRTTDTMVLAEFYSLLVSLSSDRNALGGGSRPYSYLPDQLKEMVLPMIKTTMMRRIQLSDPTLVELQIGGSFIPDANENNIGVYGPSDGADAARLGSSIGTNNHLETLHFDGTLSPALADTNSELNVQFFDGLKDNLSVQTVILQHCDISGLSGNGILTAFKERASILTELSLSNCDLGNEGTGFLVSTLERCTHLKTLDLPQNNIDNAMLARIVSVISGQGELETLRLNGNIIGGSVGCNTLANLLEDPQCNLETLELKDNQLDANGAIAFATALSRNSKLQNLLLFGNGNLTELLRLAFLQVLCDTSSVNATFLSNHTLTNIGIDGMSEHLSSYLQMNTSADKDEVAIKKICQHHPYIDMEPFFEWDLKVLPKAVDWFDRAIGYSEEIEVPSIERRKLSAINQFARSMPLLFVPASHHAEPTRRSKRKLESS